MKDITWLDSNNYPTTIGLHELQRIDRVSAGDWTQVVRTIEKLWSGYGRLTLDGCRLELATGGWSGNEDVIGILGDSMFWMLHWDGSHRGGLHVFVKRGEP